MKLLAAAMFLVALVIAQPAAGQSGWGQTFDRSALHYLGPGATSPAWRACTNESYRFSHDEVIAGCGRIVESSDSHETRSNALWWRALAYERAGQAELSEADFQTALGEFDAWSRAEEHSIDAHFYRASMLVSMRQYDQALAGFAVADRMLGRQPRVIGSVARVAFLRGDYATAIAEFDRADSLARRNNAGEMLTHNRCEARAAAGSDLEQARTICNRAVRDSQSHPAALVSRGFFRFRQNDLTGALADFERALARDRDNPAALYGRGVIAARAGQQETAAADLDRARQLAPRTVEYYANAGMRPN